MLMNNKNDIIYVNMLGEFSITIGSQVIMDRNNQSKKPWSLLEYLITFRDRNIPVEELIDLFWKDEASNNPAGALLGLDSDTFYIYHVAAVMVDNLRRLLLGINLSDKAIMDFDFPGVGFPV